MESKKLVLDLLEQEVEDFIQTQAEKVIEFEDDPMAYILNKYPSLNDTLTDLMTKHFGDYVTGIYVMAPKPTTFKILLHNGQFYYLIYAKDSYIAKIMGKKYYLLDLGAEEYAIKAIADLLTMGKPPGAKGPDDQEDNITITDKETTTDIDVTDDGGGDEEDLSEAKEKDTETDDYGRPFVDPKGSRTYMDPDEMTPAARARKMMGEKKIKIVKEVKEAKKNSPLKFKILKEVTEDEILDPTQSDQEIEQRKDDLQDLLNKASSSQQSRIKKILQNLEYIDKVNDFISTKKFDDIEEIIVEKFIDRNDQYKIFYEYLPKILKYSDLPSEGNFLSLFNAFGFSDNFLKELISRDYQAGGKGVGPGELFLVTLLKDTFKGDAGDIILAGGKEIEVKSGGAQLSTFSRSDKFENNFYKWLKEYNEDYFKKFKEGKFRFSFRLQNFINSLSSQESSAFIKDFVPYFTKIYSERVDISNVLNKSISNNNFNGRIFEEEMAKVLATSYIEKESIEGFLFLNKQTGDFDTFTSSELIDNISDKGKIEIMAFTDMSPRLRLKK